jgi:sulfonate transport system permease protein
MNAKAGVIAKGLVLPLLLVAAWTALTSRHESLLFPSPQKSVDAIVDLWRSRTLQGYLATSLRRYVLGLSIGTALGFATGTLVGSSRIAERFLLPNVHMFRQVPLVGWIPLLIVWFGLGDLSRVVLIAMASLFPILLNTHAGFRQIPRGYLEVGEVFGLSGWEKVRRISLPAALPWIRTGSLLSLSFGWTILVASELLTQSNGGLTDILDTGRERFRMELVNAGIVVLGLLGFAFNLAATKIWSIGSLCWRSQNIHPSNETG